MSGTLVALYRNPWGGLADANVTCRRPYLLWRKAQWFKANPRSASYMRSCLSETWPEAEFVDTDSDPSWPKKISGAAQIVLLYPDAIGVGFGSFERQVRGLAPRAIVQVLNGRRRVFLLDGAARRALRVRRFLERTMLLEFVVGGIFLVLTPVLLGIDFAGGRR